MKLNFPGFPQTPKKRPPISRFMRRIASHPRLPFTQVRYHASIADDGSGPYRVLLFNKGTPKACRLLDDISETINRERLNTRRSWNFARGWAGDLPNTDRLGEISAAMYPGTARLGTQIAVSDYISLVAIMLDVSTGAPIGVTSFGFSLMMTAENGAVLDLTCCISDVWISKSYRSLGLSRYLIEVVVDAVSKYLGFLDSGFTKSELNELVNVLFEANAVSRSGHRFVKACATTFQNEVDNDEVLIKRLSVVSVMLET